MVYQYFYDIPVFLRYVGLPVYNFLLHIDTGMTKIPSFRFSAVYRPALCSLLLRPYPSTILFQETGNRESDDKLQINFLTISVSLQ